MLDLIAAALKEKGLKFRRIDGQSSMSQRKEAMETFGSDPECNIMLASIGAAGEGCVLPRHHVSTMDHANSRAELISPLQNQSTSWNPIGTPWQRLKLSTACTV